MNKYLVFLTTLIAFSPTTNAMTEKEYSTLFERYHGCFILFSVNQQKIVSEYNPNNRCNQRLAPDSIFKIPLSLMAFNQGIINQKTVFKWNGTKGVIPEHEQDQTPNTWMKYSVVWVSQKITPQLGYARIKHYLAGFDYGNQDFSGDSGKNNGLTHAWLSSSLTISAHEQLNFLNDMLSNKLPLTSDAVQNTITNMYLGKLNNGANYYGKTGSGRHGRNERTANPSLLREGWFVGFVEKGSQRYIFVSNLTDKTVQANVDKLDGSLKPFGSQLLKPIVMKILNTCFVR